LCVRRGNGNNVDSSGRTMSRLRDDRDSDGSSTSSSSHASLNGSTAGRRTPVVLQSLSTSSTAMTESNPGISSTRRRGVGTLSRESALELRRRRAARVKCSSHSTPGFMQSSVDAMQLAQHGRRGTVTKSGRGEGNDAWRTGRRVKPGDAGSWLTIHGTSGWSERAGDRNLTAKLGTETFRTT